MNIIILCAWRAWLEYDYLDFGHIVYKKTVFMISSLIKDLFYKLLLVYMASITILNSMRVRAHHFTAYSHQFSTMLPY